MFNILGGMDEVTSRDVIEDGKNISKIKEKDEIKLESIKESRQKKRYNQILSEANLKILEVEEKANKELDDANNKIKNSIQFKQIIMLL